MAAFKTGWTVHHNVASTSVRRHMSHQQLDHTETGPRFKVSSERLEKRRVEPATFGLIVHHIIRSFLIQDLRTSNSYITVCPLVREDNP